MKITALKIQAISLTLIGTFIFGPFAFAGDVTELEKFESMRGEIKVLTDFVFKNGNQGAHPLNVSIPNDPKLKTRFTDTSYSCFVALKERVSGGDATFLSNLTRLERGMSPRKLMISSVVARDYWGGNLDIKIDDQTQGSAYRVDFISCQFLVDFPLTEKKVRELLKNTFELPTLSTMPLKVI